MVSVRKNGDWAHWNATRAPQAFLCNTRIPFFPFRNTCLASQTPISFNEVGLPLLLTFATLAIQRDLNVARKHKTFVSYCFLMTTFLKGYGVNKSIPLTLLQLKVPLFLLENVLISQHKNVTASILPFSPFTSEMTNPAYVEALSLFGC